MKLFDTSYILDMIRREIYEEGAISILTVVELLRGVKGGRRAEVKEMLEGAFDVIGLDNDVLLEYFDLYEELKRVGSPMNDVDLLIAATAKARGLTLITKDRDFVRLREKGLFEGGRAMFERPGCVKAVESVI